MPLVLAGATSGSATVQATDAATVTITMPATSGTLALTSGGGSPTFTSITTTSDSTISGLTVGKGGGAQADNIAIGVNALAVNTGASNMGVGYFALKANTSGARNAAFGVQAMALNTTGNYNSAFGGEDSVGYPPLYSNTTGSNNTAIGSAALALNTTSSFNTATGYQAGLSNTTGDICAFGSFALKSNTTGVGNVAFGGYGNGTGQYAALQLNTTGSYNTAVGNAALQGNTTGGNNTAIGYCAGYSNTAYGNHTYVGYQAGFSNVNGNFNTCVGLQAGYSSNPTVPNANVFNCFMGYYAGFGVTTGVQNTFIGGNAPGYLMTTGNNNVILGNYSGNSGGLDIRGSSNYIVISDGSGNVRLGVDDSGAVFLGTARSALSGSKFSVQNAGGTAGYFEQTGAGGYNVVLRTVSNGGTWYFQQFATYPTNTENGTITSNGSNVSYNTSSDYRLKENIAPLSGGLNRVLQLKPVTYRWKETGLDGEGFIAHELQEVIPEAVVGTKDQVNEDGSIKPQGIDTSFVVATLVAAIQELNAKVTALEAQLGAK